MRSMGKREIGKLSVFDLVISVMIAEIAVIVIEDLDRSMWEGIVPMVILLLIQVGIAFVALKNRKIRLLFDGKPSVIIAKGKINREVMRKQRYNLDDLMQQLRENRVSSLADVEFAILETTGKLSVVTDDDDVDDINDGDEGKKGSSAASMANGVDGASKVFSGTKEDSRNEQNNQKRENDQKVIPPRYRFEMLPIPLIMDGKVQDRHLEKLEKTRFWLKNVLQEEGVNDFKDVFLCTIDHRGKLFVDSDRKPRK
ncbi:MAG: YetF domain-containing protein [Candidatus Pristimantibacillus sp.]